MNPLTGSSIFSVQEDSLLRLNPTTAVEAFRDLLHAEAAKRGIPISRIHISTWINVPDGGIDASVDEAIGTDGLIKSGRTGYQIKAGGTFEPWQDAEIRKALFDSKSPSRENLGASVRDCMLQNGFYVLVCVKKELAESQYRGALKILRDYFEQCGFQNPKVDVWGISNLIGFYDPFPSLALRLNGFDLPAVQSHTSWSRRDDMLKEFKIGPNQQRRW